LQNVSGLNKILLSQGENLLEILMIKKQTMEQFSQLSTYNFK